MATLYITEYSAVLAVGNDSVQIARQPPMAEQTVAIGGASVQSAAFNTATRFVRLHTDVICSVTFGTPSGANNPVATAAKARLAANQTEYFAVNPGDAVAVITNA